MGNPAEIKRKHFRFPAYDDEVGVKLVPENKRKLFSNESTEEKTQSANRTANQDMDSVNYQYEMTEPTAASTIQTLNNQNEKQKKELKKSKLPNYLMSHNKPGIQKQKNNLFGSLPKKSFFTNNSSRKNTAASHLTPKDYPYDGRSYFVPKYIPASVIPDSEKPEVSEHELTKAMKKNQNSYLLFDDEPAAFQVKGNNDPTVKKFNIPKQSPEIPVTRRQYQQIKPDLERFGKDDISQNLPRSRKDLKTAKEKAKSQTAYGQKVATVEAEVEKDRERKKPILDKPLEGIIEDSSNELENSKYFT